MRNRSGWWMIIVVMLLLDLYVFQIVKYLSSGSQRPNKNTCLHSLLASLFSSGWLLVIASGIQ